MLIFDWPVHCEKKQSKNMSPSPVAAVLVYCKQWCYKQEDY